MIVLVALPSVAGCGGDGDNTNAGGASGNGETPGKTTAAEKSETPGKSEIPGKPETARKGGISGEPSGAGKKAENPRDPESARRSGTSGEPSSPRNPGNVESPRNDNRRTPGNPRNPGTPENPRNPGTSENRRNPGNGENPRDPSKPGEPEAPGTGEPGGSPMAPSDDVTASNEVRLGGLNNGLEPPDEPHGEPKMTLGRLKVGESQTYAITVRNATNEELTIAGVSISPVDEFRVAGGSCTARPVLQAGKTCTARVTYMPTALGSHGARLSVRRKPCTGICSYEVKLVGEIMQ